MGIGLRTPRDAAITFVACGIFFALAAWVKNCGGPSYEETLRAAARPQGRPSQWTGPDTFEAIRRMSVERGSEPSDAIDFGTAPDATPEVK